VCLHSIQNRLPKPRTHVGMVFVPPEEATRMETRGELLAAEHVAGYTYGFDVPAIRRLAAAGRLVLLDLDSIEQAQRLQSCGFKVGLPALTRSRGFSLFARIQRMLQPQILPRLGSRLTQHAAVNPCAGQLFAATTVVAGGAPAAPARRHCGQPTAGIRARGCRRCSVCNGSPGVCQR
jgi:hypothetical protein